MSLGSRPRPARAILAAAAVLTGLVWSQQGLAQAGNPRGGWSIPPDMVRIDNVLVPWLSQSNQLLGNMSLEILVHASDPAGADRIELLLPRLRDALTTSLYVQPRPGESATLSARRLEEIKGRVLSLLRQWVGSESVQSVFVTQVRVAGMF